MYLFKHFVWSSGNIVVCLLGIYLVPIYLIEM